jgi:hypothetical protein
MARLKSKQRKSLPASAFAYPAQRKYPIHDKAHARNALSRAAQSNTFGTYAHVAAAVKRRYPGITTRTTKTKKRSTGRRTSHRRKR